MNHKINFTIIIPHKNTSGLLYRNLKSIPVRDDIQIIIIDDNSDPNLVDFSNFPGLEDPRVEIIFSKESRGAGYARNLGLNKAIGNWLIFADSDDFFNYCINQILDEHLNSNADIIFFKHCCLDSSLYVTRYRSDNYNHFINNWLKSKNNSEYYLRYRNNVIWSKLFKRKLIQQNNILFDEVYYSNDMTFAYLAGFYAKEVIADPRALYCTTIRKGSIRYNKRTINNNLDMLYVDGKRYLFMRNHGLSTRGRNSFSNCLTKLFLLDRKVFNSAKDTLITLGFKKTELFMLCISHIILYLPKKLCLLITNLIFQFKLLKEFNINQI